MAYYSHPLWNPVLKGKLSYPCHEGIMGEQRYNSMTQSLYPQGRIPIPFA